MSNWIYGFLNESVSFPKNLSDFKGFIYIIKNIETGKFYIGQKTFWSIEHKKALRSFTQEETDRLRKYSGWLVAAKKGREIKHRVSLEERDLIVKIKDYKKKIKSRLDSKKGLRRKCVSSSDWQDYWSSSEPLKREVEILGKDKFSRTIVRLCRSKAEMNYFETKMQFDAGVLLKGTNSYNGMINCRISCMQVRGMKQ